MPQSFPAHSSGKSLRWAVLLALLIIVPFFLILVFSSDVLGGLSLAVIILPLAISGLIIYASYASGKMKYILGIDELKIDFPISPLKVNYSNIRSAGKVETRLTLRLFGGSLPGSHWGHFATSNIGTAQVYATKYKGEFVLLELLDGKKILISPQEPDVFLEALTQKTTFTVPKFAELVEPRLNRRLIYTQIIIVAVAWFAFVAYVASIYSGLPEIIPVHFGLNGVPNRYGSKVELLLMVVVSALFPILNTIFAFKYGKYNKNLTLFLGVVFILAVGLFALVVSQILRSI